MSAEKPAYRIQIVGGCAPEELLLLQSQVRLRQKNWGIVDNSDANVIIYNLDDEAGQIAWSRRDPNEAGIAHVAFATGTTPEDAKFSLDRSLRSIQLISLFDEVEQGASESSPAFLPESRLLGLLQSISGDVPVAIGLGGPPGIIVVPDSFAGFSAEWDSMFDLARTPAESIRCEFITAADMEKLVGELGLVQRSLEELVWFAALVGSEGQPLSELDVRQRVQLKQLPGFSRLYHRPTHVRIGVMMKYHPLLLDEIARRASAPIPDVIDLYNACICMDFIEVVEAAPPPPKRKEVSAERSGLFKRILSRLSQVERATG